MPVPTSLPTMYVSVVYVKVAGQVDLLLECAVEIETHIIVDLIVNHLVSVQTRPYGFKALSCKNPTFRNIAVEIVLLGIEMDHVVGVLDQLHPMPLGALFVTLIMVGAKSDSAHRKIRHLNYRVCLDVGVTGRVPPCYR